MRLHAKCNPVVPVYDESVKPVFLDNYLEDGKQIVRDDKGAIVCERNVKVPKVRVLDTASISEVSCDMFELSVQEKAGVQLSVVQKPLYGMTLEGQSIARDMVIENASQMVFEDVSAPSDENVINFNEN